jgi:hypothetical protein
MIIINNLYYIFQIIFCMKTFLYNLKYIFTNVYLLFYKILNILINKKSKNQIIFFINIIMFN